ncbi:MAG: hypothetical protein ACOCSE_03885, partial [Chitinivibrionales bacterium]
FKSNSELNRDLRRYKLSLLPSKINFDLINASYGKTSSIEDRYTYNLRETDKRLSLDHGFQFQYSPISPLVTTSYKISVDRDLNDPVNKYNDPASSDFISNEIMARNPEWKDYWILRNETRRSQDFSVKIKPGIFNWITNTADYESRFAQTPKNRNDDSKLYSTNDLSTNFDFSSRLRFRSLFKSLSEKLDKGTGFKSFLEGMNEGFGNFGFENVEFQYSADSDLKNEYVHPDNLSSHGVGMNEYFAYQLGLKDRDFLDIVRGEYDDKHAFGGVMYRAGDPDSALSENDTRNVKKGFSVSSGFDLPKPVNITFDKLSFGRDVEYTSRYERFDYDTTYTVPQVGVSSRLGIIEDIDFIRENTSRFFVKSNYDYEKTEAVKRDGENSEKRIDYDKKYTWAPFIEVTGEIRKIPINFSYNYNLSMDTSWRDEKDVAEDEEGASGEKKKEYGNSIEVGYRIDPDSDRKIELFRGKWVIPLDGKIDMRLNLSHQKTVKFKGSEKDYETLNLNMNPSIGYSITENIWGEVFYQGKLTESENGEKTTLNKFSMKVRIDF